MFRCLRSVPSIQRKLLYVVFATGLVSLIYLLSTSSHDTQGPESDPQKRGVNVDGHFDQQREPSGQTVTKVAGDRGPADRPIVIPEKTNKKDNAEKLVAKAAVARGDDEYDVGFDREDLGEVNVAKDSQTNDEQGLGQAAVADHFQEWLNPREGPTIGPPLGKLGQVVIHEWSRDEADQTLHRRHFPPHLSDKEKNVAAGKTEKDENLHFQSHQNETPKTEREPGRQIDPSDPYSGPKNKEQDAVVDAFMHAWKAYKKYAWGHDELKPVSHGWQEWMGVGLTLVDSLSTMWIMGLKDEFNQARDWVGKNLTFERDAEVQLFEIVIRELGGLMSAYYFSGDKVFLEKATDLGNKLYPCLTKGQTKIPCNRINLKTGRPNFIEISTAESGTVQLEFRALSRALEDQRYENSAMAISEHIHRLPKMDGLVGCFLSPHSGQFRSSSTVSMGASADSYYEYLLKQWIQTGKKVDWLKNDYLEAMAGMKKHLLRHTEPNKLAFVGAFHSMHSKSFRAEMEHLACFLPGTLALGYMAGIAGEDHLQMAAELTKTCYEMYRMMPTGLSPEVASMNLSPNAGEDIYVSFTLQYNLQRPETVESIFYMYRATKDPKYREWGWNIFQAFEKYTKLESGYASIDSVKRPENPGYRDKMETFYLAETLKYLYLLFSDDPNLIPLDKFVINTEAHPLPVYDS